MKPIKVSAEHDYEVVFVDDWKKSFTDLVGLHSKVLIIAPNELVIKFKLDSLESPNVKVIATPSGEAAKSPEYLLQLWEACASFGLTRSDAIVGIGGGSTTDLAGFVGATWLRGIHWYAIPTSLAGMVDASIGGKTGINSSHGKNLIGAFNSPQLLQVSGIGNSDELKKVGITPVHHLPFNMPTPTSAAPEPKIEAMMTPLHWSSGGGRAAMVQACGKAQSRHQSTE
jgi:3-dehydroquinate synthetase